MPRSPSFDDRCEDRHSIDLAYLLRKGLLSPGTHRRLTWSRGGSLVASIGIVSHADAITLRYRFRAHGSDDWHDVEERVALVWTPTRFGGRRAWFECPGCRRGCRLLYDAGPRHRCRRCLRLQYTSQYQPTGLGALEHAEKIRKQLGDNIGMAFEGDPFPDKPKGMHWRTYRRLEERYEDLQASWTVAAMRRFGFTGRR